MIRMDDVMDFVAQFVHDCNAEIPVGDAKVKMVDLMPILQTYTENLVHKVNMDGYAIWGIDKASDLKIACAGKRHFERMLEDVWSNPDKYMEISEEEMDSDGGWDYLRCVYVRPGGGHEMFRLCDHPIVKKMEAEC